MLLALACGERSARSDLVVLAAGSLGEAFRELALAYPASGASHELQVSVAGSQTLAAQVREGIAADLIATADTETMDALLAERRVLEPRIFAGNRLVWVVRRGLGGAAPPGPAAFLAAAEGRLVLAAPEVPAGRYARAALARLGLLEAAEARLVSNELDVRGVVSKLRLGEVDAGIAYATDVTPAVARQVHRVELPETARVRIDYPIALVRDAPHPQAARRFLAWLAGERATAIPAGAGFEPR